MHFSYVFVSRLSRHSSRRHRRRSGPVRTWYASKERTPRGSLGKLRIKSVAVQDWNISSALAMEILQSCTRPSKYSVLYKVGKSCFEGLAAPILYDMIRMQHCCSMGYPLETGLNLKYHLPVTFFSVLKSFWNFCRAPCSLWKFKLISQRKWLFWMNKISQELNEFWLDILYGNSLL